MADNLFNKPLIRVENLFKIFGENDVKKPTVNAIDNVSLEINRGDVMVIIGPSGSGKSTFLRSLNLLEKPSSPASHDPPESDDRSREAAGTFLTRCGERGNGAP